MKSHLLLKHKILPKKNLQLFVVCLNIIIFYFYKQLHEFFAVLYQQLNTSEHSLII